MFFTVTVIFVFNIFFNTVIGFFYINILKRSCNWIFLGFILKNVFFSNISLLKRIIFILKTVFFKPQDLLPTSHSYYCYSYLYVYFPDFLHIYRSYYLIASPKVDFNFRSLNFWIVLFLPRLIFSIS